MSTGEAESASAVLITTRSELVRPTVLRCYVALIKGIAVGAHALAGSGASASDGAASGKPEES